MNINNTFLFLITSFVFVLVIGCGEKTHYEADSKRSIEKNPAFLELAAKTLKSFPDQEFGPIFQSLPYGSTNVVAQCYLASAWANAEDRPKAHAALRQALTEAERIAVEPKRNEALTVVVSTAASIDFLTHEFDLLSKIRDTGYRNQARRGIFFAFLNQGRYDHAERFISQFDRSGGSIADGLLVELAQSYAENKKSNEAIRTVNKISNVNLKFKAACSISEILKDVGLADRAQNAFDLAQSIANTEIPSHSRFKSLLDLSSVAYRLDQREVAVRLLDTALEQAESLSSNTNMKIEKYREIAFGHYIIGDIDRASSMIQRVTAGITDIPDWQIERKARALEIVAGNFVDVGNIEAAKMVLDQYNGLIESAENINEVQKLLYGMKRLKVLSRVSSVDEVKFFVAEKGSQLNRIIAEDVNSSRFVRLQFYSHVSEIIQALISSGQPEHAEILLDLFDDRSRSEAISAKFEIISYYQQNNHSEKVISLSRSIANYDESDYLLKELAIANAKINQADELFQLVEKIDCDAMQATTTYKIVEILVQHNSRDEIASKLSHVNSPIVRFYAQVALSGYAPGNPENLVRVRL